MEQDKKQSQSISTKNHDIISFFEDDGVFVFVYKKTEKLASAVYMITNLFSDNEPMKWTLRKKVSDLVSFILTYKDIGQIEVSDFVHTTRTKVLELVSLLEVSFVGGLVSPMNFNVLKNEFTNLISTLESESGSHREVSKESISSNFFNIPESSLRPSLTKNTMYKNEVSAIKDIMGAPLVTKDEFKRSNRQNIILALIKKKKEVTIKDIAMIIKDCSEKTIQRELISFIEAGVLKRVGERRWSKYMLA
jgi:hypothetical protein